MSDTYKYDVTVHYPRLRERPRFMLHTGTETPVQQSFKDECDINNLMRKYKASGLIPQDLGTPRISGDFTNVPDFQEAQNIILRATGVFNGLSAEMRKRFDNDPVKFLEFVDDPKNADELVTLGLRERPKPEPAPVRVEVVQATGGAGEAPN